MQTVESLPARERGLKPNEKSGSTTPPASLPVRERGLKPVLAASNAAANWVAPRAGAWIEAGHGGNATSSGMSLPVRERPMWIYIIMGTTLTYRSNWNLLF